MGRCIGAELRSDGDFKRLQCHEDTGAPDILLCAACRVMTRMERDRQRRAGEAGLAKVFEALNAARFPATRVRNV